MNQKSLWYIKLSLILKVSIILSQLLLKYLLIELCFVKTNMVPKALFG